MSLIRSAQAGDQEQIVSIMTEPGFGDYMHTRPDHAMAAEMVRYCLELSTSPKRLHFLVIGSTEIWGFGISRLASDGVWELQVGVSEKFRGRGCGQTLVGALLEAVKVHGSGAARAVIHSQNIGSIKMTGRYLPRLGPSSQLEGFDEFYIAW